MIHPLGLTSFEFIFSIPIVVMFYYLLPAYIRQYYLLLINLLFYGSFGYQYIVIVIIEAAVSWVTAVLLSRKDDSLENGKPNKKRNLVLILSIALLISILLSFKIGVKLSDSIVAPLGISFYTLQALSYMIDVYNCKIVAEKNPVKLLAFLSFFPTITSGPIYRYTDFIKCYNGNLIYMKIDYYRIVNGIIYVLYGYFLKLVIAERAAIPVNHVFTDFDPEYYGGAALAIIAVTYSVQIYADFAGYSAIVIGIAQIIGYDIPENFSAPYLSRSIKEFWSRWHISLSCWLKDYIYIPLGGNRKGRIRKYLNIMITFIVSGLWHGGGWHFMVWGILHGAYQIIGDIAKPLKKRLTSQMGIVENSAFHRIIECTLTFILITIAWLFFRTGIKDAMRMIMQIFLSPHMDYLISGGLWELGLTPFGWTMLWVGIIIMGLVDSLMYRGMRIDKVIYNQGMLARCVSIVIICLVILILGIYGDQHDASYFVYRDF